MDALVWPLVAVLFACQPAPCVCEFAPVTVEFETPAEALREVP